MMAYFLGGAASVAIGSVLLLLGAWPAVCGYGLALATIMGAMELLRPAGGLPTPSFAPMP